MTLGSGNMSLAVELPNGEELNEWLAVNTIEFYNEISILYGTLMEVLVARSIVWRGGEKIYIYVCIERERYI
jgi:MOB kinase activator 1